MDVSEGRVKAIMANPLYNIPFNCVVFHHDREMKTFSFIKDFEGVLRALRQWKCLGPRSGK
jgi:hypothetical protein